MIEDAGGQTDANNARIRQSKSLELGEGFFFPCVG